MPYTSPGTVSSGTTITSTWGNAVGAATDYLANPPACRVYHNAAQSIANATETTLAFNSERFDTNTMHDTVTNNSRITFNTAGLYVVTANVEFAANATGIRYAVLRLNNGGINIAVVTSPASPTLTTDLIITTLWKFAAADFVDVRVYQTSGGALNVASGASSTPEFSAVWVGLG